MMHPDTELRFISERIGYGVFATKPIPRGTVVWILCAFDRIYTRGEVADMPDAYQRLIGRYAYVAGDGRYVLCWDHGRYVNHSCDPSMLGVGQSLEFAVRDITAGEEITCEYGGLNIASPLRCYCGAPNCRGWIRAEDVLHHAERWDAQARLAVALSAAVPQPLLPFLMDPEEYQDVVSGRRPIPSQREYFCREAVSAAPGEDGVLLWALK